MTEEENMGARVAVLESQSSDRAERMDKLEKIVSGLVPITAAQGAQIKALLWVISLALPLVVGAAIWSGSS